MLQGRAARSHRAGRRSGRSDLGQGGFDTKCLPGHRMDETQGLGMKCLPRERQGKGRLGLRAIDRLADDRMAGLRQMDPDLVRPAGFEPAHERVAVPPNCSITS